MKKILLIVLPLLLIAGTVVGLGFVGIIKIPGITKAKPKPKLSPDKPINTLLTMVAKLPPPPPKTAAKPADKKKVATDLTPGDVKLAVLWNEVPPEQLVKITEKWPPADLARVLVKMEEEKVSKYLATLAPERAALVSKEMRLLVAKTTVPTAG